MTTTDHDFAALRAAIDAGDDSALLGLADWLEERGGKGRLVPCLRQAHVANVRVATECEAQRDFGATGKDYWQDWCSVRGNVTDVTLEEYRTDPHVLPRWRRSRITIPYGGVVRISEGGRRSSRDRYAVNANSSAQAKLFLAEALARETIGDGPNTRNLPTCAARPCTATCR